MYRHLVRGHASVLNHCLSWYTFVDTHLYHSRQWFNIHIILRVSYYFARGSVDEVVLWWARLSVCLSVCLSSSHTCNLYQFFCACWLWPWLSLPPAGWRNPKGKEQFLGFPPHWQCTVTRSLQKVSAGNGVMGVHSTGDV